MKKIILKTSFLLCLLAVNLQAHSMSNKTAEESPADMTFIHTDMTENELYPLLNDQDRAVYDKLDAQERQFVIRMMNKAPELQMMNQTKKVPGQIQQMRGMMQQDRDTTQQDQNTYQR